MKLIMLTTMSNGRKVFDVDAFCHSLDNQIHMIAGRTDDSCRPTIKAFIDAIESVSSTIRNQISNDDKVSISGKLNQLHSMLNDRINIDDLEAQNQLGLLSRYCERIDYHNPDNSTDVASAFFIRRRPVAFPLQTTSASAAATITGIEQPNALAIAYNG